MNLLDLLVLATAVTAAVIGYRVGFLMRTLSWLGLAGGLAIGLRLTPRLGRALADASPGTRLVAVASLLIGLALMGQTCGLFASSALRRRLELTDQPSRADRVAGGALGVLGVLTLVWLLTPALRSAPGGSARAARDSALVGMIEDHGPRPPRAARLLGRLVSEAPYPIVDDSARVGNSPPAAGAGPRVDVAVARSVVRVDGPACGFRITGTGFAVGDGLILTNAHVVAGERATRITASDGRTMQARVVVFDGRHDIALLRVPAQLPALTLGPVRVGTIASVLGHPNGGELRAAPARVARRIDQPRSDIRRVGMIRTSIVGLAARLLPGDSGAPVVGGDGVVQAMVFAVDPAAPATGFALASDELRPFVREARTTRKAVSTGSCL